MEEKKGWLDLLLTAWTFPQNLVGMVIYLICKARKCREYGYKGRLVVEWHLSGGVSLGWFIFVSNRATETTIKHEYGHTIQSLMLGWLYLIVVGLPSIVWAGAFRKVWSKTPNGYYKFYTEKWADKLGGVKREN